MIGYESIHLLEERFKEKWHSFCCLHSDFEVSLWWPVFCTCVWYFCLNCSCLLDELQVSDTVVKNEHLENWLAWGARTVIVNCGCKTCAVQCGQELLCGGSFGLLAINGGPSLTLPGLQKPAFQSCALGGDSCPSGLQEALLECSGVICVGSLTMLLLVIAA